MGAQAVTRRHVRCSVWLGRVVIVPILSQLLLEKSNQVWRTWPAGRGETAEMDPDFLQGIGPPVGQYLRNCMDRLHRVVDHLRGCAIAKRLIANEDASPRNGVIARSENRLGSDAHSAVKRPNAPNPAMAGDGPVGASNAGASSRPVRCSAWLARLYDFPILLIYLNYYDFVLRKHLQYLPANHDFPPHRMGAEILT